MLLDSAGGGADASCAKRDPKRIDYRSLLLRSDVRVQRQGQQPACRRLRHRKVSRAVSKLAEGRLQMQWYRVVDPCPYALFMQHLKDVIPARYLHDVQMPYVEVAGRCPRQDDIFQLAEKFVVPVGGTASLLVPVSKPA